MLTFFHRINRASDIPSTAPLQNMRRVLLTRMEFPAVTVVENLMGGPAPIGVESLLRDVSTERYVSAPADDGLPEDVQGCCGVKY